MPWPIAPRPAKEMVGLGLGMDIVVERVVEKWKAWGK